MVYIERSITPYVQKAEKNFKAVLITGARQAGKSTLLKKLFPSRKYITFDDPFIEEQAIQNAGMFMTLNQPPVTFDEVQRIPDLFRYIKIECDKRDEYGLYCLSGSQPFRLMQNVSESLSGRISIIELAGLSLREIQGDTFDQPFLPSMDYVMERQKTARQPENIWQIIHRGSFPELYQNPELDWQQFYASYIKTYLDLPCRIWTFSADLWWQLPPVPARWSIMPILLMKSEEMPQPLETGFLFWKHPGSSIFWSPTRLLFLSAPSKHQRSISVTLVWLLI